MIDNHSDVHVGLLKVSGIIHKTVQILVKKTGSSLVFHASTILSTKSIHSQIFWFILSKRIIQFLITIQNKATRPINHGKERGCQNNVNQ